MVTWGMALLVLGYLAEEVGFSIYLYYQFKINMLENILYFYRVKFRILFTVIYWSQSTFNLIHHRSTRKFS